jgi:hypothetical protein
MAYTGAVYWQLIVLPDADPGEPADTIQFPASSLKKLNSGDCLLETMKTIHLATG